MRQFILVVLILIAARIPTAHAQAQNPYLNDHDETANPAISASVYGTKVNLRYQLNVYIQQVDDSSELYPAVVLVHGGGWDKGNAANLTDYARVLHTHNLITVEVDYRTLPEGETASTPNPHSPEPCVQDMKTVIRWLRQNADKYHIDRNKIAAFGESAGGYMAAHAAYLDGWNHADDATTYNGTPHPLTYWSAKPNLLILMSPILSVGTEAHAYEHWRFGSDSTDHDIITAPTNSSIPVLLQIGYYDTTAWPPTAKTWHQKLMDANVPVTQYVYYSEENPDNPNATRYGACHQFFRKAGADFYNVPQNRVISFLHSHGYGD